MGCYRPEENIYYGEGRTLKEAFDNAPQLTKDRFLGMRQYPNIRAIFVRSLDDIQKLHYFRWEKEVIPLYDTDNQA